MKPGILLTMLVAGVCLSVQAQADCDRDCVIGKVKQYVDALVAHDVSQLKLAKDVRSTENGEVVKPGRGVWRTVAERGGYHQIIVDSELNSAVFFGAFTEKTGDGQAPLLMAIRFGFDKGEIKELEHLLSRPDARNRLINRHKLTEPNSVYEETLPADKRQTREQLIAAGHAYFDAIQNSVPGDVVMHPECNRRENGVMLLSNPEPESKPCPIRFEVFNYITKVRDRRVAAVDEERGLVLMYAFFDVPGNVEVTPGPFGPSDLAPSNGEPRVDSRKIPRSLYIAELFRVVDGQIRDIEAVMFNLDLGAEAGW